MVLRSMAILIARTLSARGSFLILAAQGASAPLGIRLGDSSGAITEFNAVHGLLRGVMSTSSKTSCCTAKVQSGFRSENRREEFRC